MLYNKSLFEKAYNTLKLKFIYKEIQHIENIRILELGVRRGLSTSLFLKTCEDNNGRMISIDIDDCGHLYKNDRWNFICTRDDDYEKIDKLRGLDISITTTARNDDEGRALLRAFNFPLKG